MPELPEVETIRRLVERHLVGRALETVEVRLPKLLRDSPFPSLDPLLGRSITGARRRAKILIVDWSGDLSLLVHFKLSGQLAIEHAGTDRVVAGHPVPDPHGPYPHRATHVIFGFAGGNTVYFSDVRQFGWLRLMPTARAEEVVESFGFGPEAVGHDSIELHDMAARLARRRIAIKTALLNQQVMAGLGNIYVDEALHRAAIHPGRPANLLRPAELVRLHAAISWSLERGIEQGGAKIVHNRAYPKDGFPQVHGRAGEPCVTCSAPITKIRVGARGTYFCHRCQPA